MSSLLNEIMGLSMLGELPRYMAEKHFDRPQVF